MSSNSEHDVEEFKVKPILTVKRAKCQELMIAFKLGGLMMIKMEVDFNNYDQT